MYIYIVDILSWICTSVSTCISTCISLCCADEEAVLVAGGRGVGRPAKRGRGRGASTSVSTLSGSCCTRSAHKTPSEDRDMSGELSEPCPPTVHTHMRMHTHTSRHCELYFFDGHRDYSRFSLPQGDQNSREREKCRYRCQCRCERERSWWSLKWKWYVSCPLEIDFSFLCTVVYSRLLRPSHSFKAS